MTTAPARRETTTPAYRLRFDRELRGEWIKLATLRSTWWSIGITALLTIGLALLIASATSGTGFPPIQVVVSPLQFTMLLAGILGVIAVTGEYSTGMIRSTLAANPVRGAALTAKAVVVALLLFLTSLVIFFLAALAVGPILAGKDLSISWGEPENSWLPLLAASASMAVFALIGTAFGFLIRSGAGAIAATVGLLFVLPIVVALFPTSDPSWEWIGELSAYLPMSAAQFLIYPYDGATLSVSTAALALASWVAVGLLGSWAVFRTRDA